MRKILLTVCTLVISTVSFAQLKMMNSPNESLRDVSTISAVPMISPSSSAAAPAPIWSDDFLRSLSQNKIGINLSQGKSSNFYSSDRLSQLIGNGLLVMIDEKTKIGKFFEKNEIIT